MSSLDLSKTLSILVEFILLRLYGMCNISSCACSLKQEILCPHRETCYCNRYIVYVSSERGM